MGMPHATARQLKGRRGLKCNAAAVLAHAPDIGLISPATLADMGVVTCLFVVRAHNYLRLFDAVCQQAGHDQVLRSPEVVQIVVKAVGLWSSNPAKRTLKNHHEADLVVLPRQRGEIRDGENRSLCEKTRVASASPSRSRLVFALIN